MYQLFVEVPDETIYNNNNDGIGIDLGLKRPCDCF